MGDPAILCTMKDEAPFILEWLAYHKAIGFKKFLIFSNDSTDGTTEILNALDAAGEITHKYNEFDQNDIIDEIVAKKAVDSVFFNEGDWVIWLDADEFLNIHLGTGTVQELISKIQTPQGICVGWRVFGDSGQRVFNGRFISESFVGCAAPGFAWDNVKTLFRYDDNLDHLFHHKPIMKQSFWDNGGFFIGPSGLALSKSNSLMSHWINGRERGKIDAAEACWDMAQINHYAVRTKNLFKFKRNRGRAGAANDGSAIRHNDRYFRDLNRNECTDRSILAWAKDTSAEITRLMNRPDVGATVGQCLRRNYPPEAVKPSSSPVLFKPKESKALANMPNILITTCMKDEGPFILEWVAWHKAIGVSDIVVFTNDCSDGTIEILDRLQKMGELVHLPNPAIVAGSTFFQPVALNYTKQLPQFRAADYFISIDVDEFINVRSGQGHLNDLFTAVGEFDVLSMSELNHGANMNQEYKRGWVTEIFQPHQNAAPGKWKAQRGVKSIVRLNERLENVRNHRPDINNSDGECIWLDGSGRPISSLLEDSSGNGIDCRGTYTEVILDHYPLRSLESYLVKMFRGDVVIKDKRVSHRYWKLRNQNGINNTGFQSDQVKAAHAYYDCLLADNQLESLHEVSCQAHENRIKKLLGEPEFKDRRDWILSNAWE